jgi:hypothetical protein
MSSSQLATEFGCRKLQLATRKAIAVIAEAHRKLGCLLSYADALSVAIRRMGRIEIDGLRFERRADIVIPTDYVSTGRHTMVFELAGTGKQYRVTVEPVAETHQ